MLQQKCQYGRGRIGFSRVLVEVEVCKEFKEFVDVKYKDDKGFALCKTRPKTIEELVVIQEETEKKKLDNDKNEKGNQRQEYKPKAARKTGQKVDAKSNESVDIEINNEQKREVEFFINQKLQPTPAETSKWSYRMVNYFKDRSESMNSYIEISDEEDVLEDTGHAGKSMEENEIDGVDGFIHSSI
ncbi:hypothetical protein Tco_1470110 [Tanacetum coccineum]